MIVGVFLVVLGILIAIFPVLISYMIAFMLVMLGAVILMTSYRFKKMKTKVNNRVVDFLIRF